MFARIRWRLVGWNVLVVAVILVVLGTALYQATSRNLLAQLDRDLDSRAEQASSNFAATLGGEPASGPEGYQGAVFYLVMAGDGRVLVNPQRVDLGRLEVPASLLTPGTYANARLDGEAVRLYSTAIRPPGRAAGLGVPKPEQRPDQPRPDQPQRGSGGERPGPRGPGELSGAVLVVGTSMAPVEGANRFLLLFLVVGGAVGLLLSFAGAWFLAGRSMGPIEQAFLRQQEFVADASHELRTPLTVIRSATDLLAQDVDRPLRENAELVQDVRDEIDRLQRLVGDLLTLARSDRGQLVLESAPLNTRVMAAEAIRRLSPLAQERGVEMVLDAPDPAPTVEADPDRLRQVLLILLDNALKHTPAGGRVACAVRQDDHHVVLEVTDTGSGIAPEHLPHLFERFYRADSARARVDGGTGLGLAIAKALVDAHGGSIAIASELDRGTRVTVRLPLAAESPSLAARLGHIITQAAPRSRP